MNFDIIYKENHKRILNRIISKIGDVVLSEELTNDVFMKVYKHLDRFDETKASMSTWIMNIAKNTIIDHYRRAKKVTLSLDAPIGNENEEHKNTYSDKIKAPSNPYKEMVSGETMSRIQDEISNLNPKYREIAELSFNQQLSYEDIATRLDITL